MISEWNGDWEGDRNRACSSLLELFTVCLKILKKTTFPKFIKKLRQFLYLHQESFLYSFPNVWLKWNWQISKLKNTTNFERKYGALFIPPKPRLLNFRELPVANRAAFSKISIREDDLAWYTQIFENFPGSILSVQLCTGKFPEISVEWLAFRKFNRFPDFWNFSGKYLYHLPLFLKFRKF